MSARGAVTYRLEIANRVERGHAVGTLYGVARYVGGRRFGWVLQPQEDEDAARRLIASGAVESVCDDGEEPYALCEASIFRARDDEWFLLEWWGASIGYVVCKPGPSLYACDSGPLNDESPAAPTSAQGRG